MIARLVRAGQAEPAAFYYGRTKPKRQRKFDRHAKRWRYGDRGRRPGQMVQIDHLSVSIDTGFSVKEFKAVCPVSKLCCMRANAAGRYEFHQFCAGEPSVGALNVELPGSSASATPACRLRRSGKRRPCRRIMKTSTKAHLPPEKSNMY